MSMGDAPQMEESQGERDMFALGQETRADYLERFVPLENELIANLSSIQDKRPQARGRAGAEVRQSFDKNYDTVSLQNTLRGADPSSGAAMMGLGDASVEEAKLQTRATSTADQSIDDSYYAGQRQIMNMGQGVRSGSAGLSSVSAGLDANQANIAAQARSFERNAMVGAGGMVIGAAGRRGLEDGWFGGGED